MKFKKLTKEQILISADRLTRFKSTKDKYLRVFSDIITTNLIEPKIKKSDIRRMNYAELTAITEEIINSSLNKPDCNDYKINKYLREYENSIYNNDEETREFLENKINYNEICKIIPSNAPVNLKWLKSLSDIDPNNIEAIKKNREDNGYKYPVEKVLLVEGITEEILLPVFGALLGFDFCSKGIQVIAAGGKNQVVKMYYRLALEVRVPIFILLDKDAEENIFQITPKLRDIDKIHLVSCGEFEDLLPKNLIVKTVNSEFKNFLKITSEELNQDRPAAKVLEELFKTKGLHEFKKAEFAKSVKSNITDLKDVSPEIMSIINEINTDNILLDTQPCS